MGGRGRGITAVKVATLLCLAYSAFYLFLHLQQHLASQEFHVDVKNKVTTWFHVQVAEFYDIWVQKIVPRLNKSLDKGGDYVEK
jgi:uncharacterized membrane protein YGL010W